MKKASRVTVMRDKAGVTARSMKLFIDFYPRTVRRPDYFFQFKEFEGQLVIDAL